MGKGRLRRGLTSQMLTTPEAVPQATRLPHADHEGYGHKQSVSIRLDTIGNGQIARVVTAVSAEVCASFRSVQPSLQPQAILSACVYRHVQVVSTVQRVATISHSRETVATEIDREVASSDGLLSVLALCWLSPSPRRPSQAVARQKCRSGRLECMY